MKQVTSHLALRRLNSRAKQRGENARFVRLQARKCWLRLDFTGARFETFDLQGLSDRARAAGLLDALEQVVP